MEEGHLHVSTPQSRGPFTLACLNAGMRQEAPIYTRCCCPPTQQEFLRALYKMCYDCGVEVCGCVGEGRGTGVQCPAIAAIPSSGSQVTCMVTLLPPSLAFAASSAAPLLAVCSSAQRLLCSYNPLSPAWSSSTRTHAHTHILTHMHACMHAQVHTHACTHTRTHTRTRTHTHMHTHTHTPPALPQVPTTAAAWPPIVYSDRASSVESVMRRSVEAARHKYGPKPLQLILVLLPTKVRACVSWW